MTPARFRACLLALSFRHRQIAELFMVSDRRVRAWAGGSSEIPPDIAAWLEALTLWVEAHPIPRRGTPLTYDRNPQ
jgi:hypothetical protein